MLFIFSSWHTDSSEAIICFQCWQNETAGMCRDSILTGWEHNRNVKASVGNKSQALMEIVDCHVLPHEQIAAEARHWKAGGWWQDAVSELVLPPKGCSGFPCGFVPRSSRLPAVSSCLAERPLTRWQRCPKAGTPQLWPGARCGAHGCRQQRTNCTSLP